MGRIASVQEILIELTDPRRQLGGESASGFNHDQWVELLELASAHGVLGLLLHNLGDGSNIPAPLHNLANRRWRAEWALTLRLRQLGHQILESMSSAGVPCAIFKGTDFADHLYPHATLRPTRDIDLLVPQEHWPAAGEVLAGLSYEKQVELSKRHEATEYGEQCWRLKSDDRIAAELHWNLIRNPSLRRRASISYHDLNHVVSGEKSNTISSFSPASRLIIAVVHATFIHQFDRLLLLCDIREAARAIATHSDVVELREIARKTHTESAVDVALSVIRHLLDCREADSLRRDLGFSASAPLSHHLVSRPMVLYPPRKISSLRRVLMREWLKRAA